MTFQKLRPRCANCDGYGWVCENHPDVPWEGVAGYGCECGPGMPCSCNDADPPWDFEPEALAGVTGRRQ